MDAGDRVRDRYRLERWIASGGMGSVWEAYDLALEQSVALKRVSFVGLSPHEAEQSRARTLREARTAARLRFVPHVIATLDVIEDEGDVWLVQEYLPSRSLSDVLAGDRRLPLDEVARIGAVVARALDAAARAGVVHRDVKPGNVLIAEEDGVVKITDFGISHAEGESRLTRTNAISGTPAYMAREVAVGEDATPASDVFSLGSTLYRAAEGLAPFGENDNLARLLYRVGNGLYRPPEASGPLTPLLLSMLEFEPGRRPTAARVAESLDAILARLRSRQAPTLTGTRTPAVLRTVTTPAPVGGTPPGPRRVALQTAAPTGAPPVPPPPGLPDPTPDPTLDPGPAPSAPPDPPVQTGRRAVLVGGAAVAALVAVAVVVGPELAGSGNESPVAPNPPAGGEAAAIPQDAVGITAQFGQVQLPPGTPGRGKPAIALGSKDFSEQDLLNELYTQALRAKGYTVNPKPAIGSSEIIDRAFASNQIQIYPEYTGVAATGASQANQPTPPTASATYQIVKQFVETQRQGTVFLQTPFQDTDTIVVRPEYAQRYSLITVEDLNRVAPGGQGVRLAAQPSFRTRQAGLLGLQQQYGLNRIGDSFVGLASGADAYQALDGGAADAIDGFTTDPQLSTGQYVQLQDPKNVFGSQYVVPIVKQQTALQQGPEFEQTCNWVSSLLSLQAIQAMNGALADGLNAASVAQRFLGQNGLR